MVNPLKKEIFKELNKFNKETSVDTDSLMATFSGQLFKSAPCFLAKIKMNQEVSVPKLFKTNVTCLEKETALNALGEYVKKEIEKTHQPVEVAGDAHYLLKTDPLQEFLNKLSSCCRCFSEDTLAVKKLLDQKIQSSEFNHIDILFVGDYPRLVGESIFETFSADKGEILNRMVHAMNLPTLKWYVTYLLKCNRMDLDLNLKKEIINTCFEHVKNEIFLLQPKVVISFGALATQMMLGKKERLADIHGKFFHQQFDFVGGEKREFTLVPIFHPEYLLINPTMKKTAWVDLKKVIEFLSQEN